MLFGSPVSLRLMDGKCRELSRACGGIGGCGYQRFSLLEIHMKVFSSRSKKTFLVRSKAEIKFPRATKDWGTIHYIGFFLDRDDHLLLKQILSLDVTLRKGDTLVFQNGEITVRI